MDLQSILSSFIGSFFGFVSALVLFYLQEKLKQKADQAAILENLKLEITYNIILYEKYEKEIQRCIEELTNGIRNIYLDLDYDFVARYFAKQFYSCGLLLKHFHPEDMRRWNVMLTQISEGSESYLVKCISDWRDNSGIKKEDVFRTLQHEKNQINYAKEMSSYILKKLDSNK